MTEVLKWVGIAAAVWVVVAVTLAALWHRFMKAQPSVPRYDGDSRLTRDGGA